VAISHYGTIHDLTDICDEPRASLKLASDVKINESPKINVGGQSKDVNDCGQSLFGGELKERDASVSTECIGNVTLVYSRQQDVVFNNEQLTNEQLLMLFPPEEFSLPPTNSHIAELPVSNNVTSLVSNFPGSVFHDSVASPLNNINARDERQFANILQSDINVERVSGTSVDDCWMTPKSYNSDVRICPDSDDDSDDDFVELIEEMDSPTCDTLTISSALKLSATFPSGDIGEPKNSNPVNPSDGGNNNSSGNGSKLHSDVSLGGVSSSPDYLKSLPTPQRESRYNEMGAPRFSNVNAVSTKSPQEGSEVVHENVHSLSSGPPLSLATRSPFSLATGPPLSLTAGYLFPHAGEQGKELMLDTDSLAGLRAEGQKQRKDQSKVKVQPPPIPSDIQRFVKDFGAEEDDSKFIQN